MKEDENETTYYYAITHHLPSEDMGSEEKYEEFMKAEGKMLDDFTKSLPDNFKVGSRMDRFESIDAQSTDFYKPGMTVTIRIPIIVKKTHAR